MNLKLLCLTTLLLVFFNLTICNGSEIYTDSTLNADILGPRTEKVDLTKYFKILYVSKQKGSDNHGDGSQRLPWQSLTFALEKIRDASLNKNYAVFVAEGIYDHGTIRMKQFVDIFGGFYSETWERDINRFKTILDGKGVRRTVVAVNNSQLDGFMIRNGLSRSHGGGILCDDTSPTISNNFIINNFVLEPESFNHERIHQEGHYGAGIACLYNAVPLIRNNIFYGNKTSVGMGGALAFYGWVRHKSAPAMRVENNRLGGGLRAIVKNNVIVNNCSGINDLHRTRSSSGGGIACAYEARPIIQNNLIAVNKAKGNSDAGGIYCEYFSDPDIIGNWVLGNVGDDDGGGFYSMKLGQPLLRGNIFAGNFTTSGGAGGIRLSKEGRARIIDNIIIQNPGGGVMSVDAYIELENNIIADNAFGSGLNYVNHFNYFKPSRVSNNIFYNNEKGSISIRDESVNTPVFEKNFIQEEFKKEENFGHIPLQKINEFKIHILSCEFDQKGYTTIVTLKPSPKIKMQFKGRIIRINEQWSIIKAVEAGRIVIWGDITMGVKKDRVLEIIPEYVRE